MKEKDHSLDAPWLPQNLKNPNHLHQKTWKMLTDEKHIKQKKT